ncbi:dihydropteroate synthase [Haloimpatiens sp. FM7315]|uniref:dihydropteroate synthase n=1 Tax=Haloimpatiens sp. FM7315 TaxID=3298609 RepID=UPI0035A2A644
MEIGSKIFDLKKQTYIMGILNITPDSFSDGGNFNTIEKAVKHAKEMIKEGAHIIDIGGESTRPNHTSVSEEEEIKRVIPIVEALRKEIDVPISIDTYKSRVAELALNSGASLINDIWGFKKDKNMAKVAAKYNAACCLMHNRDNKNYTDFIEDLIKDLKESIDIALKAGVKKEKIILDPGFGFAKTPELNLKILNKLESLNKLDCPILLGTSRKSTLGLVLDLPVNERVEGTVATTVIGITKGCNFIRVHDVKENSRASLMTDAILRA